MRTLPRPPRRIAIVAGLAALAMAAGAGAQLTLALFSDTGSPATTVTTQSIFSGERVSSAFSVTDDSGGVTVDRSDPAAFGGDGRTITTSAWASSFAGSRYVDVDLNAPLPGGLAMASASFRLGWASATAGSTACYYFEVRRASSGAVVATYGSAGSPIACVTGTSMATSTTSIGGVATTDIADDLRIRIFGRDSAGGSTVIDEATVGGDTATLTFTLYPVRITDAADSTASTITWGFDGP